MPGSHRSAPGQVDGKRLHDLIEPVVTAAGMDLESVRATIAGRRRLLRVVVDSDHGVSLDDAADLSREVSAVLDAADPLGEMPYTLEVSSPGVDRPLTTPRHWRRAAGRLVRVKVTGEGPVEGRVIAADADGVSMDVAGKQRRLGYENLGAGAIQIEFGRVADAELAEFSDPALDDLDDLNDLDDADELGDADDLDDFDNAVPADSTAPEPETDLDIDDIDAVRANDTELGAGGDGH